MPALTDEIALDLDDLRALAAWCAGFAAEVLPLFAADHPDDPRPAAAIAAALTFAQGGPRNKPLRDAALAALKSAGEATRPPAQQAARAAMSAAASGYLHPLARATQVKHILGAPAHAALARSLESGDPALAAPLVAQAAAGAPARIVALLHRYPPAPAGGGRIGMLIATLDAALRDTGKP